MEKKTILWIIATIILILILNHNDVINLSKIFQTTVEPYPFIPGGTASIVP